MINLTQFRRSGLWLLSFIAALLVLSSSAGAADCYINGLESSGVKMTSDASNNKFTYTYTAASDGKKYIYIWDGVANKDVGPYTNNTAISFSNNTYTYEECHENSYKWVLDAKSGTKYVFTYYHEYSGKKRLEITQTATQTATHSYYLRGAFNSWTGTASTLTGSGTTRTVSVSNWSNKKSGQEDGLKIVYNNGTSDSWYGGSSITSNGGSSTLSTGGGNITLPSDAEGKTVTFTLTLDGNYPSSLKATWSSTVTETPPGIKGEWQGHNNWNGAALTDFTKADGSWWKKPITMPATVTNRLCFRIFYNNQNYQPNQNGDLAVVSGTEYPTKNATNAGFLVSSPLPNVTYTIWFNTDTKKVKVTWDPNQGGGNEDPDPTIEYSNEVQILGDFSDVAFTPYNGWTKWSSLQGTVKQDNNEYYYTFSPARTGKVYFRFKINGTPYHPDGANDGRKEVYCEFNNWDHDNSKAKQCGDNSAYCWYVDVSDKNKTYTIHIRKDHSGTPRVMVVAAEKPFEGRDLPVYPKGVTNKAQLNAYTGWPIYYLQSYDLNNERLTPEYQMNRRADGKYELKVTMYSTSKIYVEKFEDAVTRSKRFGERSFTLPAGNISGAGREYTVVYDPATKSITFENKGIEMPFLSMIGKDWKQNTITNDDKPFKTPFEGTDAGDYIASYKGKSRDTDYGWQEAWIQYNGEDILKDRKGNVMYTTMWPQADNADVIFKTSFESNGVVYDDFSLTSSQLTFVPQNNGVAKKGSEWKADPRFAKVSKSGLQSGFSGIEYKDVLALDDNTTYVLYSVDGMWVNGDVKLWTGWNGAVKDNTRYGSLWTNNWGHYKALETTTKISAGSTVPLGDEKGDMTFPEPTYFKSVDFFLNTSNPAKGSLLFTELAKGGAEIAAMSRENYTYGMYRPRLTNTTGLESAPLTSVKITTYKSNDDTNTHPINVVADNTYTDKKVSDWKSLFTFNGENSDWVNDPYKYENGHYKYVMEVEIDGEKIIVESNPFTIFVGEATAELRTYQLVKREIPTNDFSDRGLGHTDYQYVTYSTRPGDQTYLVKVKLNQEISENTTVTDALLYDDIKGIESIIVLDDARKEFVDYTDGTRFRFSAKLLFVGKIRGKNVSKVNFNEEHVEFSEVGNITGSSEIMLESSSNDDSHKDTFYAVAEPVFYQDLDGGRSSGFNYTFNWSPQFSYDFQDAEGNWKTKEGETDNVTVEDYLVFPEPKLILSESRIEMFYGDTPSGSDDVISNQFSINVADNMEGYESDLSAVTLGDPDNNRDGARFQQIRTAIVVERPNVTRRYLALASDYIIAEAKKDGLTVSSFDADEGAAPLMEAIFDFFLGGEQVKMSNGRVFSDNGGNPEWFVYYTPTRKPSDIYYNVFANDAAYSEWDLATNLGLTEDNVTFKTKTMTHSLRKTFDELHIYPRWEDGDIAGIRIQQNPPVNALNNAQSSMARVKDSEKGTAIASDGNRDTNIRVIGSGLYYDDKGELIERVNVKVNFVSETKNSLARVDKDGQPYDYNDDSYAGKDMHYDKDSGDDYFYVRIVNEDGKDLVDAHAVSAKEMADGYTLTIEKNHGHYYDGQLEAVQKDPIIGKMTLKMSHLYPFVYGAQINEINIDAAQYSESPAHAMRKADGDAEPVVSDLEGQIVNPNTAVDSDVIKSNPVDYTFDANEVFTSVEGLEQVLSDSVITGEGYILVHGQGVEIFGADGVKIATGEGRHEVPAGVYVVRLNNRVEKVIVR